MKKVDTKAVDRTNTVLSFPSNVLQPILSPKNSGTNSVLRSLSEINKVGDMGYRGSILPKDRRAMNIADKEQDVGRPPRFIGNALRAPGFREDIVVQPIVHSLNTMTSTNYWSLGTLVNSTILESKAKLTK
eukprot:scaffold376_cov454-Pavlova_lutheri.AAC.2